MSSQALKRVTQQGHKLLARSFHTSKAAAADAGHGGHGGHGAHDYDHYLHAEHMYEIWNMKHRKLKWGLACAGVVSAGFIIPSFAIHWQKSKAAG
ncbi:hypothetical protein WJX73_008412 [Symbiochloris irregularis]|uniref:Uncharacterized protein n=1 Tax=Symbiochloris irregularis TaxID=706552 RepID=A0AAW1NXV3_9CHLO